MCIIYGNTQMNTNYKLYKCIEHTYTTKHTNISYKTIWECDISKGSIVIYILLKTFDYIVYKHIHGYVCMYVYS